MSKIIREDAIDTREMRDHVSDDDLQGALSHLHSARERLSVLRGLTRIGTPEILRAVDLVTDALEDALNLAPTPAMCQHCGATLINDEDFLCAVCEEEEYGD